MNNFHRNIILPFDIHAYEYTDTPDSLTLKNNRIDFTRIEPIFFEWLNDYGITCCSRWSRYFSSLPNQHYSIHADSISENQHKTKINIIFDSHGTIMKWYDLKSEYKKLPESLFVNGVIRIYKSNQCDEVFQTQVNSNCIIDGSKIHTLVNGANQGKKRKCFSFALKSLKTDELLSFEESVDLLRI